MGNQHSIKNPAKDNGEGSTANGGELLFLALATCYCNDIYREANKMGIKVTSVEVECRGEFEPGPGSTAQNVTFDAKVTADAEEK